MMSLNSNKYKLLFSPKAMEIRKSLAKSLTLLVGGIAANYVANDPEVSNYLFNAGIDVYNFKPLLDGLTIAGVGIGSLGTIYSGLLFGLSKLDKKDYKGESSEDN